MDYPRYWYVINDNNYTSFTDGEDDGESFDNEAAAVSRAEQLARDNPGSVYEVVSTVKAFVAPIGNVEPVTIRK